jgi:hypothetical protein
MADTVFEFVAGRLEEATEFDKLEARGTVRIALKEAGLDARSVTKEQMAVMLQRTMATELKARGVEGAESICQGLVTSLKSFTPAQTRTAESPEDVFRRLGGR